MNDHLRARRSRELLAALEYFEPAEVFAMLTPAQTLALAKAMPTVLAPWEQDERGTWQRCDAKGRMVCRGQNKQRERDEADAEMVRQGFVLLAPAAEGSE